MWYKFWWLRLVIFFVYVIVVVIEIVGLIEIKNV